MKWTKEQIDIQGDAAECRGLGGYLMGRTKRRHRAWKQQMKAQARKRRGYGYRWDDDISPGRLVAWVEPERGETDANKKETCPCEGQATN